MWYDVKKSFQFDVEYRSKIYIKYKNHGSIIGA